VFQILDWEFSFYLGVKSTFSLLSLLILLPFPWLLAMIRRCNSLISSGH
jgi:hypothetical protein